MTIAHEPVHRVVHKPLGKPRPHPAIDQQPRVDVYLPRQNIRIDTTFWQHRSIFAGTQEQLNELRREADERAAARAYVGEFVNKLRTQSEPSIFEVHRPAIRQLKAIVHIGLVSMLWAITTCKCGGRWPCNDIKQYLRHRVGWTTDITDELKTLTKRLPRPMSRWRRLLRSLSRQRQ